MSSPERETTAGREPVTARHAPASEPDPARTTGRCQRCGFPVVRRLMGCKNPCRNCGTVYPFGDCSD